MRKRSSTKQRDYTFFTDRDLGRYHIPGALEKIGVRVERHDLHFPPKTPDTVWLAEVGRRGWIALSRNHRMLRVKSERDTAMRAGLALFLLMGKAPHPDLAASLVCTLPKIMAFCDRHQPPFIAKVYRPDRKYPNRPGCVKLALSREDWQRLLAR